MTNWPWVSPLFWRQTFSVRLREVWPWLGPGTVWVAVIFDKPAVTAIDVRGGHVSVSGWTKTTQMLAADVIRRMQSRGVRQFVYTNADRDGMLNGPDVDEVRSISEAIRGRFIYSGGIASLDDLRALKELRLVNLAGVISGKALYEGRFTVEEAQELLRDRSRERAA